MSHTKRVLLWIGGGLLGLILILFVTGIAIARTDWFRSMVREKIVAAVARKFICLADQSKLVDVLGKFPLPLEVIPMARSYVARELVRIGGQPTLRQGFTTDNGNVILDVHNLQILKPIELESELNQITGVVTNGLFARRGADVLLLGTDDGIQTFTR